eukprot:TRINITY_DN109730_c0_g1_i1.p1 TRINITY_DN109730_c0_g1~~TRINITY_DN109730_c0_g1_i1.p1  ORF type:complete len:101 (-),score=17.25 TRINITY_DN109730_c0_g1_i1:403-672(-)
MADQSWRTSVVNTSGKHLANRKNLKQSMTGVVVVVAVCSRLETLQTEADILRSRLQEASLRLQEGCDESCLQLQLTTVQLPLLLSQDCQ